jgi:hypothetical protein
MKQYLILFLLFFSLNSRSQEFERKYKPLEDFILEKSINPRYKLIEINKLPLELSDSIKKPLVSQLSSIKHFDHLVSNYDAYKESFKIIDLNNDGLLDIFYSGYLGGASDSYSYIFINCAPFGFHQDFYGEIGLFLYAVIVNQNIQGLVFCYEGAAASCPEFCKLDLITYEDSEKKINNLAKFSNYSEIPIDYFVVPIEFKVKNEKYYLRSDPKIDNDIWKSCESVGNIHFTYKKGDIGTAYSQKKDVTGRVWWFVIMSDGIAGWMSSHYLEKQ